MPRSWPTASSRISPLFGHEVWRDTRKIRSGRTSSRDRGRSPQHSARKALLSPHAICESGDSDSPDDLASVCLDDLHLARFSCKVPIVPMVAVSCPPSFVIFRLDYVEMLQWHDFGEAYQRGFRRLLEAIETARPSPQDRARSAAGAFDHRGIRHRQIGDRGEVDPDPPDGKDCRAPPQCARITASPLAA